MKTTNTEKLEEQRAIFGDTWQAYYAAAEMVYIAQYGTPPEWHMFVTMKAPETPREMVDDAIM